MAVGRNIIIEFNMTEHTAKEVSLADVAIDKDNNIIYWVHSDLNDMESFKKISKLFHLPQNLIDLCTHENKLPVFIDDDDVITLQVQCALSTEPLSEKFALSNLIIHLSKQFCFTAAFSDQPAVDEFLGHYKKFARHAKTSCFILFLMLDSTTNDYAKLLFNYELLVDEIDDRVRDLEENIYQTVMDHKQQIMRIKRNITSVREILMRISGRNISVISEPCRLSLNNLSNHSHLVINEADSIRDILNGLLGQIDNALMQKMNQIMKVLTAFAAIFLPLTLITGIYGMNFHWIPELSWKYGYFFALALIIGMGVVMFAFFKFKKWF